MSLTLLGAGKGVLGGAAGPTVVADLNWLTDPGILNMVGAPIENGFYVGTWPWATGGTATSTLAIAAGADGGPVYDLTNGVGSDGTGNMALTLPSPITIPALATADWDIWVYCVLTGSGNLVIGRTVGNGDSFIAIGSGGVQIVDSGLGGGATTEESMPTAGTKLFRFGNEAESLTLAWTGQASHAMLNEGYASSLVLDTLLARAIANTLAVFSDSGEFLKALRIVTYPPGYADRASYRSTVETAIAGAPLT